MSGNDKRCSRFINQYGIDLIDDGIMQTALYQLVLADYHIVTQVIKSQFIIGNIGNVAVVGSLSFFS